MLLNDLLQRLATDFSSAELVYGHGTDNAWDEAVALCLGALQWSDDEKNLSREVPSHALQEIEQLAQRRIVERIPVPLLLGRALFAGYEFNVTNGVMIPRSPFAELIRKGFSPWLSEQPTRILDLCAGGGCIGIACALHWQNAQVVLSEIDPRACELARANIAKHELEARVGVAQSDLFEQIDGRFDLIVCNPPYVPTLDSKARDSEFQYESDLAYDGGADGMELVGRLVADALEHLTQAGTLFIEVGQYREELEARFPRLALVWPDISDGGEGVCLIGARDLAEHAAQSQIPPSP